MKSRSLVPNLNLPTSLGGQSAMNLTLSFEVTPTLPARSRLVDSFNYMMGLIESEPYPFKHKLQIEKSELPQLHILDQENTSPNFAMTNML